MSEFVFFRYSKLFFSLIDNEFFLQKLNWSLINSVEKTELGIVSDDYVNILRYKFYVFYFYVKIKNLKNGRET